MKTGEILFLSKNDVAKHIGQQEALELTEKSIEEFALGNINNPSKLILPCYPYHNGHINSMPSYMKYGDVAGVKVVSVYNDNPKKYGLPTTIGTIILYDPEKRCRERTLSFTRLQRTGRSWKTESRPTARRSSRYVSS